ncbi:MAG: PAS domain S-box protein [Isosphaeraceae bacterium]
METAAYHQDTGTDGRQPPHAEGGAAYLDVQTLGRLLDLSAQPFALLDFGLRFLRVNRAFEELLGYTADELRQLSVKDVTTEPSMRNTLDALECLAGDPRPRQYDKEYVRKDGTRVPVSVVAHRYHDEAGVARGYFAFIKDTTERVRAEEALRESEARFRGLYDEAPFGYHEIDAEGRIVNVNRTECELLGYSRDELIGRPVVDLVAPELRPMASLAVAEKISGRRPLVPFEREYLTRDGRRLTVRIEERHVLDRDGRIVGLRTTIRDITAAKQVEAALVASERRARALFEGIQDAVFVHDLEGRILDANPAACRRLGYSREEFLGLTTRDIDVEGTAEGFLDRLAHQLNEGGLCFEGAHRDKRGRAFPVDVSTSVIRYEDHTAVLAVCRDVTERKALEEARRQLSEAQAQYARELEESNRELMRSEARARQLTQGCLDAVIATDEQGRITSFNPAAEKAFGYPASEAMGRPLTLLIPDAIQLPGPAADGESDEPIPAHLVVGRTVQRQGCRRDGEVFPIEVALGRVDAEGERAYIASIRDQTERQRMYAVLARTEKLASIGLLSAGLAHEINNPLAYVSNNLAVLERDFRGIIAMFRAYDEARDRIAEAAPDVVEQVRALAEDLDWEYVRSNIDRTIGRTREGVQRVTNIVHNLRSLARTAPPKLERASLGEILDSALEIVQGEVRKAGITVDRAIDSDLPKIPCADSQIGQVFLNILVNAIQAVEKGRPPGEGRIRVALRAGPGGQVVEIADNGPGIAEEHLAKVFDPFFTTKPIGEGTGLGLAFSHGIITGHGGRIEIDSAPGQGALFRVTLPHRNEAARKGTGA